MKVGIEFLYVPETYDDLIVIGHIEEDVNLLRKMAF